MQRRCQVYERETRIDAVKGRTDSIFDQRCGRVIEFGCTVVSNHRHPPKNQDLMVAQNHAAEIEMAPFLKTIRLEYVYNF